MTVEAFPLAWPPGWRRTPVHERTRARFGRQEQKFRTEYFQGISRRVPTYVSKNALSVSDAVTRILEELAAIGVDQADAVVSTNLTTRNDGLPRSGALLQLDDPGAAVYWTERGKKQRCMVIDRYDRVQDNLAAIAATLSAMRAIERHGGASILDRAFSGFAALPAPEQWFQVLSVSANADRDEIESAYRRLAAKYHPDRGGDVGAMTRINRARDQGLEAHQ